MIAKERGLRKYSQLRKAELIHLIEEAKASSVPISKLVAKLVAERVDNQTTVALKVIAPVPVASVF